MCNLVPSLQTGNEFQEALPLVNKEEAPPLTMVSQPGGWERGNTRLWTYLSAIRRWRVDRALPRQKCQEGELRVQRILAISRLLAVNPARPRSVWK
ncbi:hypothetical protein [Nostoc sp.]|uniref:hypothetical protein n=1 Tax=Nostoc sp. TaxID=1180 RepID=UPI002FF7FEB9